MNLLFLGILVGVLITCYAAIAIYILRNSDE